MKSSLLPLLCLIFLAGSLSAQAQFTPTEEFISWPEIFNQQRVYHLELEMAPGDWATIQGDTSYSIEVPAMFGMAGEKKILVAVRRKSCDALQNGTSFAKVSLKIDVNELVQGQTWHSLKKLSLENGDDEDVVTEGFAWALHNMAHAPEGYGYQPGLANWVTVTINGVNTGVYVSAEQVDKKYLKNRQIWTAGETWLYKLGDIYSDDLKAGNGESPDHAFFCYDPFQRPRGSCQSPDLPTFEQDLATRINMQGMLTMGAVNAFMGHGDSLFSKGKNIYFADFLNAGPRLYLPWDLDSVLSQVNHNIFNPGDHYADSILAVPSFRAQFKQIMLDLLDGPMHVYDQQAFLDQMEPILTPYLLADPNSKLGDAGGIASKFQAIKSWVIQRDGIVRQQIVND